MGNFLKKEETIENHFTYFGQTYDEETGLYYLRARYYDPTTGRFTGLDPAEDVYNGYVYGNQNPVVYADWTGEEVVTITTALVLLGLGIVYEDGDTYEGEVRDGERHGEGKYIYKDGDFHEEEFANDELLNGVCYDKTGKMIGRFVDGEAKLPKISEMLKLGIEEIIKKITE